MKKRTTVKHDLTAEQAINGFKFISWITACYINLVRQGEWEGWEKGKYLSSVDPQAELVLSGVLELKEAYFKTGRPAQYGAGKTRFQKLRDQDLAATAIECEAILKEYHRAKVQEDFYYPRHPAGGNIRDAISNSSFSKSSTKPQMEDIVAHSGEGFEDYAEDILKKNMGRSEKPSDDDIKRVACVIQDVLLYSIENETIDQRRPQDLLDNIKQEETIDQLLGACRVNGFS